MSFFNNLRFRLWRIYRLIAKPCALEINLVAHCNLNCAGCTHYSPIAPKLFMSVGEFREAVEHLKKMGRAFGILRLLGGEPLMHPDLLEILEIAGRELKGKRVELYTNGVLLSGERQSEFVEALCRTCRRYGIHIYITVYPINIDYEKSFATLKERGVSVVLMGDRRQSESFRLMLLDPSRRGCRSNYYLCTETDCMQLVGDRIYPCSESAYCGFLNEKYERLEFRHRKGDYIEVKDIRNALSLRLFRMRSKPFCEYCVFPRPLIDWHHSQSTADEWVKAD